MISFTNKITITNTLNFKFGENFNGIEIWLNLFYTNSTDSSLYKNWTFPNTNIMDDFYFSKNTTELIESTGFIVGKESLKQTYIEVDFKRKIDVKLETNKTILGIPI